MVRVYRVKTGIGETVVNLGVTMNAVKIAPSQLDIAFVKTVILETVVETNVLRNARHATLVQYALHVPNGFGERHVTSVTKTVRTPVTKTQVIVNVRMGISTPTVVKVSVLRVLKRAKMAHANH